jgi:uncharacterized membrane protein YfcA
MLVVLIGAFSLLAGFVDSVVGGGGLIQLPAMLILSQIFSSRPFSARTNSLPAPG